MLLEFEELLDELFEELLLLELDEELLLEFDELLEELFEELLLLELLLELLAKCSSGAPAGFCAASAPSMRAGGAAWAVPAASSPAAAIVIIFIIAVDPSRSGGLGRPAGVSRHSNNAAPRTAIPPARVQRVARSSLR